MAHNQPHDEDLDLKYAILLSEELNGGHQLPLKSTRKAPGPNYDADADFAYALEVQFGDSYGMGNGEGSRSHSHTLSGASASQTEDTPWAAKKDHQKDAHYDPNVVNGKTFSTLADFIQHLKAVQCSTCGYLFFKSALDVSTLLRNWKSGKAPLTTSLKCPTCPSTSCIACIPQPFANASTMSIQGKTQLSWCCNGGRLFLLWLLLCGVDDHYFTTKEPETTQKKAETKPDKKKKPNKSSRSAFGGSRRGMPAMAQMPSGMGYGSDMMDYDEEDFYEESAFSGAGHTLSGRRYGPNVANTGGKAKAMSAQNSEDQYLAMQIELVESLLPLWDRESSFDFDPPEFIADMLVHSKILHCCTELLRNDSLEDATKRIGVYQALFKFLRTLAAHWVTASRIIFDERPLRQDKACLLEWCWQNGAQVSEDKTASLFSCLRNLAEQSNVVLQGAKSNEREFQNVDGQNLLVLCRNISDLQEYLAANAHPGEAAKQTRSEPEVPGLSEIADNIILAAHKFGAPAKALSGTRTGRFKRLITEITTLSTGLPPGIFVRYAESRPDVLKVVIVGPKGTPYESGLFEFDIWCDGDYPNSPPLVQFKTTGGGRTSFNPNLYPDGKVCLSLINTWSGGTRWSSESTLLQVVVSIQAMILCDEPWYNEPGREMSYTRDAPSSPSAVYNQGVQRNTVRIAMLEWLDKTPPLWKDVVDQHFRTNANKILETVVAWAKTKMPAVPRYDDYMGEEFDDLLLQHPSLAAMGGHRGSSSQNSDMRSLLPQLQKALKTYGATYVVPAIPEPVVEKSEQSRSRRLHSLLSPTPQPPQPPQPPHSPQPHQSSAFLSKQGYGFMPPAPGFLQPNPYAPTSPTFTPDPPPSALPGWLHFGSFPGPGHVVGGAPAPTPSAPGNSGRGTGRYETRSSTRGRGGANASLDGTNMFSPGSFGRGRGGASNMADARGGYGSPYPTYPQGRGGTASGGSFGPAAPAGQNMWPFNSFGRGGGRGRGGGETPRGGRGGYPRT